MMGTSNQKITPDLIAAAEKLIGLSFSDAEREQMQNTLNGRLQQITSLHDIPLQNSDGMALLFEPEIVDAEPAHIPRTYPISAQSEVVRPSNLEDVAFYPVTKLATLIHTRQVTSLELTQMYLERLKRYDPVLQCVVTLTEDLAIEQATRADDEIRQGYYRGALHGIPWGAKDLLATKRYKTTWGAMPFKDQAIDTDATVISRLEAAGAVLIAKLSLGALAYGDVWFGGVTKNPWDVTEGSSGSSAGPGSATAAGLVGFSIGSETWGSIVSPATRNGVTGLRPTFGRVSRYGAMALSWSMDKIGPMGRSVEDCALVFSAIYGADGKDLSVNNKPFSWNPALNPRTLRIGYVAEAFEQAHYWDDMTDDQKQLANANYINSNRVLDCMRGLGFNLIPITLSEMNPNPLSIILLAEAAAAFDELTRSNRDDLLTRQDDEAWANVFRAARFISAVDYIQANRARGVIMRQMAAKMELVDAFIVPSSGGNSLLLTNLTGHPAVVVPNGFSHRNTPTSITFIGGLNKEAEMLAVAKAYQDATDFHLQYPSLDFV